jgi:hypothetical protein
MRQQRPRIVVTVRDDGTVSAETVGVLGEGCLDYVAILEDLLAARAVESAYTADWHRTEATVQQGQQVARRGHHDVEHA